MTLDQEGELEALKAQLSKGFDELTKDNPALKQKLVESAIRSVLLSWGGSHMRIPSLKAVSMKARNIKIKELRKNQRISTKVLKERFSITGSGIRKIIAKTRT